MLEMLQMKTCSGKRRQRKQENEGFAMIRKGDAIVGIPVVPKEERRKIERLARAGIMARCKRMANYK